MLSPSPLWFWPERQESLRRSLDQKEDWLRPILATLKAPESEDVANQVVRAGFQAWVESSAERASQALSLWLDLSAGVLAKNELSKSHGAMAGAILGDCARALWSERDGERFLSAAQQLLEALLEVSEGNPHAIGNNWWAVTHGAFYCLASQVGSLPVLGRPAAQWAEWAWARLEPFLGHFGPSGAYHEGLGYEGYACAYLLPAIHARHSLTQGDFSPPPGFSRLAELFLVAAMEGPALSDTSGARDSWGRMLSWNDAGLGWLRGPAPLLAIALAPPESRRQLRALWDRLSGHLSPQPTSDEFAGALFFHAAFYWEAGKGEGHSLPPTSLFDSLHGLWIARNRYRDSQDTVVGALARAFHPGGHSHDDAGSVRFSAGGWDWLLGGGQARPRAEWQTRLVPSDSDSTNSYGCGAAMFHLDSPPVFGMDLRRPYRGYGERYVALRPDENRAEIAILDLVDDHRKDREWWWCASFSPELEFSAQEDRFFLQAPDGQRLEAVFLLDRPLEILLERMPDSQRKFANSRVCTYPGRPFVRARFAGPSLNILTALAVDAPPPLLTNFNDLSIAREGEVWQAPFGVLVPVGSRPRLRGFCRYPAGPPPIDHESRAG